MLVITDAESESMLNAKDIYAEIEKNIFSCLIVWAAGAKQSRSPGAEQPTQVQIFQLPVLVMFDLGEFRQISPVYEITQAISHRKELFRALSTLIT